VSDEKGTKERLIAREGQAARLAAILERRRMGSNAALAAVEAEARQEERSLFKLAEIRAKRLGVSTADLFAHDRAALEQSAYPGENCLEAYEVELYAAGQLSDERMTAHARECAGCGGLTAALGRHNRGHRVPGRGSRSSATSGARTLSTLPPWPGSSPTRAVAGFGETMRLLQPPFPP
jgi:hypothetical protein